MEGFVGERKGDKATLEGSFDREEKNKEGSFSCFSVIVSYVCFFLILNMSSALGFSGPQGVVNPPLLPYRVPPRFSPFLISLREIGFLLCLGAFILSLLHPRLVFRVRSSLKRKAFLTILLGTSLFLPFFFIPHHYKAFALGLIFIPSVIGLSGFFSALGEKILSLFKFRWQSEVLLIFVGLLPFILLLLLANPFWMRVTFSLLIIYGLGSLASTMI